MRFLNTRRRGRPGNEGDAAAARAPRDGSTSGTKPADVARTSQLRNAVAVRPIGVDDLSSVRYVHASAFRMAAGSLHNEEEVAAFTAHVYQPAYIDQLQRESLYGAWLERELVATCGWCPADDSGGTARITSLFVRPLFAGEGLGTLMLRHAEERARAAGFAELSARASLASAGFFERHGYETSAFGVRPLGGGVELRVAFMRRGVSRQASLERASPTHPAGIGVRCVEDEG
jgi:putative acetyltransferase